MRSHSHQKRKFFFFCGKWKTYFFHWEDLGRKSCAVLEEGQGTFLSFFFTLFIPLVFYFFTFFLLIFFLWISFRNEVQFTPKRTNFHFFLKMEDICLWLSKFEDLGRKSCAVLEDERKCLILASVTENTKTHFPNHMKINQKNY